MIDQQNELLMQLSQMRDDLQIAIRMLEGEADLLEHRSEFVAAVKHEYFDGPAPASPSSVRTSSEAQAL